MPSAPPIAEVNGNGSHDNTRNTPSPIHVAQ